MRTSTRFIVLCSILCVLVLMAFLAAPAAGQSSDKYDKKPTDKKPTESYGKRPPTIVHGVDVFQTSTGKPTKADFAKNPIPADFFCKGSAPFKGEIELRGVPLTTAPAGVAANGDTIVERLGNGVFVSGAAKIPVKVRALQLTGAQPLSIECPNQGTTQWKVDTCLCGPQPTTKIMVKVDQSCGCGHFDGELRLNTCLTFTEAKSGRKAGPLKQAVDLKITDMPWCPKPGAGEPVISGPFMVDTNCDGKPDMKLTKTTNFFPGWKCDNQAVDCLTQYASLTHCHEGPSKEHPHCVNPMCKRQG